MVFEPLAGASGLGSWRPPERGAQESSEEGEAVRIEQGREGDADGSLDQPVGVERGLGVDALLQAIGCLIEANQKLLVQLMNWAAQLGRREAYLVARQFLHLGLDLLGSGGVVIAWRSAVSCLADWLICCWELVPRAR